MTHKKIDLFQMPSSRVNFNRKIHESAYEKGISQSFINDILVFTVDSGPLDCAWINCKHRLYPQIVVPSGKKKNTALCRIW